MAPLLSFPDPVNEKAARAVAAGVLLISAIALVTGALWLALPLAVGFAARVASGPRFSPLGQFATRVAAPRLGAPVPVPGPPKRFAQAVGLFVTTCASVTWFGFGNGTLTVILFGLLVVAAGLESVFGICLGCWMFGQLMRTGLVPAEVCLACQDISLRAGQTV